MNFRYKIAQFMSGRYGIDTLFYVLLAVAVVFAGINCFLHSLLLQFAVYAVEAFAIFRVLSRNYDARMKENRAVAGIINGFKNKAEQKRRQKADTMHIYKKCPKCHATLRLPNRKGRHKTVCPKCNCEFNVNVK